MLLIIYFPQKLTCGIWFLGRSNLFGSKPGPIEIRPEQLNRKIWDYIFLGGDIPSETDIPHEALRTLRREFLYW